MFTVIWDEHWYSAQKTKLDKLTEAEKVAEKIMETGDVWTYEGSPAPGDDEQPEMPVGMFQDTRRALSKLQNEIDDAMIELDVKDLEAAVTKASQFINKIVTAIEAFKDKEKLKPLIEKLEKNNPLWEERNAEPQEEER